MIGTQLGPYEIVSALGAGGMGEVYKARDPKLDRFVAIKVLPAAVANNAALLALFQREAKAVAALSHPNILGIYDFGRDGDRSYAVMELLEGETLRERLAAGRMPPKKAVELALQMAQGLAAAHEKGIVHRDFKPENVFRTKDGRIKILDFGLAKQLQVPTASDATVPQVEDDPGKTRAGMVIGTAGYMSPEQARGEPADARSDVFAFGCVFLEMLTGKRAFGGRTAVDRLFNILNSDPDLEDEAISPGLHSLLEHCLDKDPTHRFHSAQDIAFALESSSSSYRSRAIVDGERSAPARSGLRRLLPWLGAGAGAVACVLLGLKLAPSTGGGLERYRFTPVVAEGAASGEAAWSRNGRTIAYVKSVDRVGQLFVRDLDAENPRQLTRLTRSCDGPFWSADDSRIYYVSGRALWSVAKVGGDPELVQKSVDAADLSPDGRTLAIWRATNREGKTSTTLWLASPPEAEARKYEPAPFEQSAAYVPVRVRFSPDASRIFVSTYTVEGWAAWLLPFPDGPAARGKPARVFARGELPSPPLVSWMPDSRHAVLSTDESGGGVLGRLALADLDRGTLRPLLVGAASVTGGAVSPDGTRLLFATGGTDYDLVEIPLDGSGVRSLLTTGRDEHSAAYMPDGSGFLFVTSRHGLHEIRVKGLKDGFERIIASAKDFPPGQVDLETPAVSPDGTRVAFTRSSSGRDAGFAIWVSPTAGGAPSRLVADGKGTEIAPAWSPDGRWIAFISTKDGKRALVKARVGASNPPVVVTEAQDKVRIGPLEWSPKGDWILSPVHDDLVLVSPDGKASRVLKGLSGVWGAHAWSRDGSLIYTVREPEAGGRHRLVAIDVAAETTTVLSELAIDEGSAFQTPANNTLRFTLSPDGKSLSATLAHVKSDIWLLEGFPTR